MERLMYRFVLIVVFWNLSYLCVVASDFNRVSPESQGVSSTQIKILYDSLMNRSSDELHGILILRHGQLISELYPAPFSAHYPQTVYSVSKTFVALAVGMAIDENRLRLTDRVASFFPSQLPETISPDLAAMSVRDLLTMRSGILPDWDLRNRCDNWTQQFLAKPVSQPGHRFQYDSMASYLLSVILQKTTGMKLIDYLQKKLFDPMKINDAEWEESPEGYNTGGWGLHISLRSMAKIGQLMLQKGQWEGQTLVSTAWIEQMTAEQVKLESKGSYGYGVWHCHHPKTYRADGALGQYIIVAPQEDMVVVMTQCIKGNGKKERQWVYDFLNKISTSSLKESAEEYHNLTQIEANDKLPLAVGEASVKLPSRWTSAEWLMDENPLSWKSVRIKQVGDTLNLAIHTTDGDSFLIAAGNQCWLTDSTMVYPPYTIHAKNRFAGIRRLFYVSSSYGWMDKNQLNVSLFYVNWISGLKLQFNYQKGHVWLTVNENTKRVTYKIKCHRK